MSRVEFSARPTDPANVSKSTMATLRQQAKELEEQAEAGELEGTFRKFVGGTLFRTLLKQLRESVGKTKLMHGGRAEEIFTSQLDQTIADRLAETHGGMLSRGMYEQFVRRLPTDGATNGRDDHARHGSAGTVRERLDRLA